MIIPRQISQPTSSRSILPIALLGLSAFTLSSQASTTLNFRHLEGGTSAPGEVAVTSAPLDITNPMLDSRGRRDTLELPILGTWGGTGASPLMIDGATVEFTIVQITDFDGVSADAKLRTATNGRGMGVDSAGTTEKWFQLDGEESFTWSADQDLAFEGMTCRDWDLNNDDGKKMSISSPSWINLTGVVPGTGITYDAGTGTFTLTEVVDNVISEGNANVGGILTLTDMVGENGPPLWITAGQGITFSSVDGTLVPAMDPDPAVYRPGTQLQTMTFSSGAAPSLPSFPFTILYTGSDLEFSWPSQDGKLYDLLSETSLETAPVTWSPYDDGSNPIWENIPTSETGTKTLTGVGLSGASRFFAVLEKDIPPPPPVTVFTENFDGVDPSWASGATLVGTPVTAWELDNPTGGPAAGPSAANSGDNCYGTNIRANYGLSSDIWLRTTMIDLTAASAATLIFQQFRDIEAGFEDRGSIRVLLASDDSPLGADLLRPIEGTSDEWEQIMVDLPPEALGEMIKIEFRFESDLEVNQAGWYIDDVMVTTPAP